VKNRCRDVLKHCRHGKQRKTSAKIKKNRCPLHAEKRCGNGSNRCRDVLNRCRDVLNRCRDVLNRRRYGKQRKKDHRSRITVPSTEKLLIQGKLA